MDSRGWLPIRQHAWLLPHTCRSIQLCVRSFHRLRSQSSSEVRALGGEGTHRLQLATYLEQSREHEWCLSVELAQVRVQRWVGFTVSQSLRPHHHFARLLVAAAIVDGVCHQWVVLIQPIIVRRVHQ